jgi:hypothetical protein
MFDVSLSSAERWYDIFNVMLFLGAFAVAVGTYGAIRMGTVKEHFSDVRISTNEAETARAVADSEAAKAQAALANERAAEANKKAEEERLARLKLEARLAPRTLTGTQQIQITEKLKSFAGVQFEFASYQEDQEVGGLVVTLIPLLQRADWVGLPAREFLMGGLVVGVVVEFSPASEQQLGPAAYAFAEALSSEGIIASVVANQELASYGDRLRIKVGKKP